MTSGGGLYNLGAIFKINSDGSGFEKLFDFDGKTSGSHPYGSLILAGDSLYGMTVLWRGVWQGRYFQNRYKWCRISKIA